MRAFGVAEGFPGEQVTALLQDSRGFLWVGTPEGLCRFDGEEIRVYGTSDGLADDSVEALAEALDGSLWVATRTGVSRLDPRRMPDAAGRPGTPGDASPGAAPALERIPVTGREPNSVPTSAFHLGLSGRLYVAFGRDVFQADVADPAQPRRLSRLTFDGRPRAPEQVISLAEMPDGTLWLGLLDGLLRRDNGGRTHRYVVHRYRGTDEVRDLLRDRDGCLWLAHGHGLFALRPEGELPEDLGAAARPLEEGGVLRRPARQGDVAVLRGGSARSLSLSHDGRVLALLVDPRTEAGSLFQLGSTAKVTEGLPPNPLCLLEDRDANVWIGTRSRGLLRLSSAGFVSYTAADGLDPGGVRALLLDPEGRLLVSGPERLSRLEGDRLQSVPWARPPGVEAGWGWRQVLAREPDGSLWLASGPALLLYPGAPFGEQTRRAPRVFRFPGPRGEPAEVFRVYRAVNGDVWVGVIGLPSLYVRRHGEAEFHTFGAGVPEAAPTAFAEEPDGTLWVGFYLGQLAKVSGERLRVFGTEEGLPEGFVYDLLVDSKGRLWMGAGSGGVVCLDPPGREPLALKRWSRADGLGSGSVRALVEDGAGRIYFGGTRGVDRLDPATQRLRSFSHLDGLASDLILCALKDASGTLWFGTPDGLSAFRPEREPPGRASPVFVTSARIGEVSAAVPEIGVAEVALPDGPAGSGVEIGWSAADFVPGQRLAFEHRLEGAERVFGAPTRERRVRFSRLSPGAYRFEVRSVGAGGERSVPATVSFRVLAPLWQRPWFLVLSGISAFGAAALLHRSRVARLLALERVRTRIATDLHDDLGSSLSRVSIQAELLRRRVAEDPEAARRASEIGEVAREMIEALSDAIWSIDPRRDELRSLVDRLRGLARDLLESRGIQVVFETPEACLSLKLEQAIRRHLFLGLKEALHNVAQHAAARRVVLRLAATRREVVAELEDDGVGFSPATLRPAEETGGRGLPGLAERAQLMGGRAEIVSATGKGTAIRIRLPRT